MLIRRISSKLTKVLRSKLRTPQSLWLTAAAAESNGASAKAEAIYRRLAAQRRRDPASLRYGALSEQKLGNVAASIERLEYALARFPQSEELLEDYVRVCASIGKIDRAVSCSVFFKRAKEEVVEFILAKVFVDEHLKVDLIEYLFSIEATVVAEKYADRVAADPRDIIAVWRLGDILLRYGQKKRAESLYRFLSSRELASAIDYYYAAVAELRLGKPKLCYERLEAGYRCFPGNRDLESIYIELCATDADYERYIRFQREFVGGTLPSHEQFFQIVGKTVSPDVFMLKYKDFEEHLGSVAFEECKSEYLSTLEGRLSSIMQAKSVLIFAKVFDVDPIFTRKLYDVCQKFCEDRYSEAEAYTLRLIYDLTLPMIAQYELDSRAQIQRFIDLCETLARNPVVLQDPEHDMTGIWTPWQSIFCMAELDAYGDAMSAFEKVARATWPELKYKAPHVGREAQSYRNGRRKIRVGFFTLDVMPMMSGLLEHLDKDLFETVQVRPGKASDSQIGKDWVARADWTIQVSDLNAYAAIEAIAAEKLDILISGPSMPSMLYPMMARLASLQMVLLEPNWTDGFSNSDYYISWGKAEPADPGAFYKCAVAYTQHPPYWVERPTVDDCTEAEKAEVRNRVIPGSAGKHLYLCANTPPKIHRAMDAVFREILERDQKAILVLLRADYPATKSLKARLRSSLGALYNRVAFLPTLPKQDAHRLLLSVDCCLDSFPLCGMSSSFDGMMLGVPIVTLPKPVPFGRWTAAIYEYIGVTDLIARDESHYADLAIRLASDRAWRAQKSEEIKRGSARYVESLDSASEFQQFLLDAWRRKCEGLPPANWLPENSATDVLQGRFREIPQAVCEQ